MSSRLENPESLLTGFKSVCIQGSGFDYRNSASAARPAGANTEAKVESRQPVYMAVACNPPPSSSLSRKAISVSHSILAQRMNSIDLSRRYIITYY